ncbi:phosphopantetheine-binding protein [Jidongwangia harbinensis]|uniref:phosphopantetheine-binding protein n=1 Tax=Jidongwangia harbinensis TaxID=2878561 RepID=UPI001CD95231|nr:acyl carrier protein [Jidongwangia harbinensis]MCA2215053.1 acyl carrier protein [Jidongwangia harbinensis]
MASTTPADPAARLLTEFTDLLVAVMGEEIRLAVDITPDTTFDGDLGIESIELVALTEQLRLRYGDRADLGAFFAGRGLDELMRLTVGDVLDHLAAAVREP